MSLLVSALEVYTPEFIRKRALSRLFDTTAAALDLQAPPLACLSSEESLATYARFVQIHGGQRLREESDSVELAERLYGSAANLGRQLNKWLRPRTMQDVMTLGRVLYRILAIDLRGDAQGEVLILRCYFSDYYSADVCRLMSAMDQGLFAGLSNGGELTFTSRITDGQPCCRAKFCLPQKRV